ncbi:hypothetical protein DFH08DRAFT_1086534 [Mycena albidolilacea]|uniref:Uncharacterized protein n=1 Tax=Mycena albidolilacea TaxID=1033008 RepID=A0AAD7EG91_9AGAR|nr:hypothetical protein DFH08DRAFT_1086534 [Mycena albidolilacea]
MDTVTATQAQEIPTVDGGLRRRLRDPQQDQAQAPTPRIVFGCLHTTHVIAGPPFSGTRWDTSVFDAAGFPLSPAPGTTNEWIDKVPAGRRHTDTRRSARLRRVSRDDSIQLLLSHLRTLSAVTQTDGSTNNGRVVNINGGLAAPAPI